MKATDAHPDTVGRNDAFNATSGCLLKVQKRAFRIIVSLRTKTARFAPTFPNDLCDCLLSELTFCPFSVECLFVSVCFHLKPVKSSWLIIN
jgi:hypothetical protein